MEGFGQHGGIHVVLPLGHGLHKPHVFQALAAQIGEGALMEGVGFLGQVLEGETAQTRDRAPES